MEKTMIDQTLYPILIGVSAASLLLYVLRLDYCRACEQGAKKEKAKTK